LVARIGNRSNTDRIRERVLRPRRSHKAACTVFKLQASTVKLELINSDVSSWMHISLRLSRGQVHASIHLTRFPAANSSKRIESWARAPSDTPNNSRLGDLPPFLLLLSSPPPCRLGLLEARSAIIVLGTTRLDGVHLAIGHSRFFRRWGRDGGGRIVLGKGADFCRVRAESAR